MKTILGVETFDGTAERKLARGKEVEQGVRTTPERRIMSETAEGLLSCLTKERIRLIRQVQGKRISMSHLARELNRQPGAVTRDVKALKAQKIVRVTRRVNPGHGKVTEVWAGKSIEIRVKL